MKVEHIDRETLRDIKEQIAEALKPLGKKLGVTFATTKGEYGGKTGNAVVEFAIGNADPVETGLADCWTQSAPRLGFDPNILGRTYKSPSGNITIRGAYPGRSKNPVAVFLGDPEARNARRISLEYLRGLIELNRPIEAKPPVLTIVPPAAKRKKVRV